MFRIRGAGCIEHRRRSVGDQQPKGVRAEPIRDERRSHRIDVRGLGRAALRPLRDRLAIRHDLAARIERTAAVERDGSSERITRAGACIRDRMCPRYRLRRKIEAVAGNKRDENQRPHYWNGSTMLG